MPDDDACYLLSSWAKQVTTVILQICRDARRLPSAVRCAAGQIATWLKTVSPYIDSLPRYWIEPELENLCLEVLKRLAEMCAWPDRLHISAAFAVRDCHQQLLHSTAKGRDATIKPILAYLSEPANRLAIEALASDCRRLYEELAPTAAEQTAAPPNIERRLVQQDLRIGKALYETLQQHCECYPGRHGSDAIGSRWHPTRLCLEGGTGEAFFDIMVSSMDLSTWQEFRLSMSNISGDDASEIVSLAQGRFCSLLDQQLFARIAFLFKPDVGLCQLPEPQVQDLFPAAGRGESLKSILRHYMLTPRDKVVLAYAIARAYWQFYDSDLMRARWNSDTIYFMPALDDAGGQIPLRAFVSFPFGVPGEPLEDSIPDISVPLNHRCPRVFALGVLLLEIGLAAPFPTRAFRNQVSQVNFDHKTAKNQLKALRAEKWLGFSHARYFVDAVEYCIEGSNFANDAADLKGTSTTSSVGDGEKNVEARRKNLFNHVVRPLAWLAETGFHKSATGTSYIRKLMSQAPQHCPTPASESCSTRQDEGVAFHGGLTQRTGRWLDQLKAISAQVYDRRRKYGVTKAVKVAILDTGLGSHMEYFQDEDDGPRRLKQIVQWRDFVDPANDSTMVDEFGHGTLMARLVVESAPFAHLIIARVARNTKELPRSKQSIAQAILWAADQGADIISMSFGFPREHAAISSAIQQASAREGGVIILASAGNSSHEDECFPASHPGVISLYATNQNGTFLESNARPAGMEALGTFGDDLPPDLRDEFEQAYPGVCQPGTSIATAVAAGIGAVMLLYGEVLPELSNSVDREETKRLLRRMRGSRGMAAVFRAMSQDMAGSRWFLNPARFWTQKNKDEPRHHAISGCLWDIDRRMEADV